MRTNPLWQKSVTPGGRWGGMEERIRGSRRKPLRGMNMLTVLTVEVVSQVYTC